MGVSKGDWLVLPVTLCVSWEIAVRLWAPQGWAAPTVPRPQYPAWCAPQAGLCQSLWEEGIYGRGPECWKDGTMRHNAQRNLYVTHRLCAS